MIHQDGFKVVIGDSKLILLLPASLTLLCVCVCVCACMCLCSNCPEGCESTECRSRWDGINMLSVYSLTCKLVMLSIMRSYLKGSWCHGAYKSAILFAADLCEFIGPMIFRWSTRENWSRNMRSCLLCLVVEQGAHTHTRTSAAPVRESLHYYSFAE